MHLFIKLSNSYSVMHGPLSQKKFELIVRNVMETRTWLAFSNHP